MKTGRETKQSREWAGDFGRQYTDRNTLDPAAVDALWQNQYGVTRTAMNRKLLADVPLDAPILEVGCNLGNQLLLLSGMGYTNLHGIDVLAYAVELAQTRVPAASIIEGSALKIPFPDGQFDLVFTSGPLDPHRSRRTYPRFSARFTGSPRNGSWAPSITHPAQPRSTIVGKETCYGKVISQRCTSSNSRTCGWFRKNGFRT